MIGDKFDDEAAELRERLKWTKVQPSLAADEQKKSGLYWTTKGVMETYPDHKEYLDGLATHFEQRLTKMIDASIKNSSTKMHFGPDIKLYYEVLHHLHFARRRLKNFKGRDQIIEQIRQKMLLYQQKTHEGVKDFQMVVKGDLSQVILNGPENLNENATGIPTLTVEHNKKRIQDEMKQIVEENNQMKAHLKELNVVFNFSEVDVDADPKRDMKAELIQMPEDSCMMAYCSPIVIYGESGSGKTALMSKIASLTPDWFPNSVQIMRFFGTSAGSSVIRSTLLSICQHIWHLYKLPVPPFLLELELDFQYLCSYFKSLLWKINSKDKPLIMLLDSADQLQPNDHAAYMHWLPMILPPFVRIIVSVLPSVSDCYSNLKKMSVKKANLIELKALSTELGTADAIISQKLQEYNRRITKGQRAYLMKKIEKARHSLFVVLVANEAVCWKHTSRVSSLNVGETVKEAIHKLFDKLEKEHGQILVQHMFGKFFCFCLYWV